MSRFSVVSAHRFSGSVVAGLHPDPRLVAGVRRCLLLGAAAVLLLPIARGDSAWFGWMPLWLVGMPLSALWALHRFRLPRWPAAAISGMRRRRRSHGQARRRKRVAAPAPLRRAA